MRTVQTLLSMLFASILLLGCTEESTLTESHETALSKSSQADPSEWKLIFEDTIVPGSYFLDLPCINDGAGETVDMSGTWAWYGKEVETPSGNFMQNLKVVYDDLGFTGVESGDVWMTDGVKSHLFNHTKKKNGHLYSTQPATEWYVDQDGQRVRFKWLWHIEFDENGDIVKWDERMLTCHLY